MASRDVSGLRTTGHLSEEHTTMIVPTALTASAPRSPQRTTREKQQPGITSRGAAQNSSDRHLMPPPSFAPVPVGRAMPRNSLKPIQFVSNTVQQGTFGETGRRGEDTRSATIKYDVNYKYTRPNYVVTDEPDLWNNSQIVVEKCVAGSPTSDEPDIILEQENEIESSADKDDGLSSLSSSPFSSPPLSPVSSELSSLPSYASSNDVVILDESILRISEAINPDELRKEQHSEQDTHPSLLAVTEPLSDDENALDVLSQKRKKKKTDRKDKKSKTRVKKSKPVSAMLLDSDIGSLDGSAISARKEKKNRKEKKESTKSLSKSGRAEKSGRRKVDKHEKRLHRQKDGMNKGSKVNSKEATVLVAIPKKEIEDGEISSPSPPRVATESGELGRREENDSGSRQRHSNRRSPGDVLHKTDQKHPKLSRRNSSGSSHESHSSPARQSDSYFRRGSQEIIGRHPGPQKRSEMNRRRSSENDGIDEFERAVWNNMHERRSPFRENRADRNRSGSSHDGSGKDFRRSHSPSRNRRLSASQRSESRRTPDRERREAYSGSRSSSRERRHRERSITSACSPPRQRKKYKPVSFSIKRKPPQHDECEEFVSALESLNETNSDGVVKNILELIETHLLKTALEMEEGEVLPDRDNWDTESVASISKMSIFGAKKPKKSKAKDEKTRVRSLSPPLRPRQRRRSLSPYSICRRPLPVPRSRPRRRSVSPTPSVRRRRPTPPSRTVRRHRASSYDTIASSQIDCAKLREVAVKNALEFRRMGKIPPQYAMSAEERAMWRSGGKTLEDLTAFCKRMAQRSRDGRADSRESSVAVDLPKFNHPFHVRDRPLLSEIIMHINNARAVPVRSQQERVVQNLSLRELYPVSSGSTHREMGWQKVVSHERPLRDREKDKKKTKSKDKAEEPLTLEKQLRNAPPAPDYRIPISFSDKLRLLKFQRELAANPDNPEVLSQMQETQQQMLEWANQFCYTGAPGEFTGQTASTAPTKLHQPWETQAWARRDMLKNLKPVGGKGQYLLQKMGWLPGQGIGVGQHRNLEPLKMEVKMDKRGLLAEEERRGKMPVFSNGVKTVSFGGYQNQHPCSALNEFCTKRGWGTPAFNLVDESGQPHRKTFLFQVKINGIDYRPTVTGCSKKLAKAEAARFCLEALGMVTKESS